MFKAWKWWSRGSLNGYFIHEWKHESIRRWSKKCGDQNHQKRLLLIIFGIFTEVRGLWPAPTPCPEFWHCNCNRSITWPTFRGKGWQSGYMFLPMTFCIPPVSAEFWHCNCNGSITCPTIRGKGWQSGYMFLSMAFPIPPASAPCTASSHMPHSWPNSSQTAERTPRFPKRGALRTLFEQGL